MTKIAYLIIAHTDVEQLIRLCDALHLSGDVFIHIDQKQKDVYYWNRIRTYSDCIHNIRIITKRFYVTWGGFSQIKVMKELLSEALKEDVYDRFVFLSGLDFPLFSPNKIKSFFEKNKKIEFVGGTNLSNGAHPWQLHKICLYHLFRDIRLPHNSIIRRIIIGGSKLTIKFLGFHKKPYIVIHGKRWDVYYGSQWVGLTNECAKYIKRELDTNKKIMRYFKYSYAPDELVIPTLVMNSHFREKAFLTKSSSFEELAVLHFVEYNESIGIYDKRDYERLIQSGKMFFRKVVSGKSEELISMVRESWITESLKSKQ